MTMHFENDGKVLCQTKGKKIDCTTDKSLVTCKRCLKKLDPEFKTRPKKNAKIKFEYIVHKKFNHCLKINNDTFLKLGEKLEDPIKMMVVFKAGSMMSTSLKFVGPVISMLTDKELNLLKDWFSAKKEETNNSITINDVKEAFFVEN